MAPSSRHLSTSRSLRPHSSSASPAAAPAAASAGYGFVRFAQGGEAQAAVTALDGAQLPEGHTLQVKAADRDAGPTPPASGLNPSDLCYVKHLPAHFTVSPLAPLSRRTGHRAGGHT